MTTIHLPADGTTCQIGVCRLDSDCDLPIGYARTMLTPSELARAATFVFDRDRDRFIRARGFLRQCLGLHLRLTPQDVQITAGPQGKPYVAEHAVQFNLSHSGDVAVVAISLGPRIGIDLELGARSEAFGDNLEGLSAICLTPAEQRALASAPPRHRLRRFLGYWTAKEARMKLTGEGMTLDPRRIALRLDQGHPTGYLQPEMPRAHLCFIDLRIPDAVCCLAYAPAAANTSALRKAG